MFSCGVSASLAAGWKELSCKVRLKIEVHSSTGALEFGVESDGVLGQIRGIAEGQNTVRGVSLTSHRRTFPESGTVVVRAFVKYGGGPETECPPVSKTFAFIL